MARWLALFSLFVRFCFSLASSPPPDSRWRRRVDAWRWPVAPGSGLPCRRQVETIEVERIH